MKLQPKYIDTTQVAPLEAKNSRQEAPGGSVLLDTASVSKVDSSDCVRFHMWLHTAFGFTNGFTHTF